MTHFDITFVFRAILLFVFGMEFSIVQLALIYFWGSIMDFADHFTSPSYVVDVMRVRIPRFLKGGDIGKPSEGVKIPACWFHLWPGAIMSLLCGVIFFAHLWWIPFLFWFIHAMVDRFQKNDETYPYASFFHPWRKSWVRKWGYPTKIRKEIVVSTVAMLFVLTFEFWWNFLK